MLKVMDGETEYSGPNFPFQPEPDQDGFRALARLIARAILAERAAHNLSADKPADTPGPESSGGPEKD